MPIYEYACKACGHQFDVLQKVSDPVLTDCPACGQAELRKLVSAPVFRLKGSGWYETDFKSEKESKRNLAGDAESKKASADGDKSDVKKTGGEAKADGKKASGDGKASGSGDKASAKSSSGGKAAAGDG
jgi:putative FmdB family regulatory protein